MHYFLASWIIVIALQSGRSSCALPCRLLEAVLKQCCLMQSYCEDNSQMASSEAVRFGWCFFFFFFLVSCSCCVILCSLFCLPDCYSFLQPFDQRHLLPQWRMCQQAPKRTCQFWGNAFCLAWQYMQAWKQLPSQLLNNNRWLRKHCHIATEASRFSSLTYASVEMKFQGHQFSVKVATHET